MAVRSGSDGPYQHGETVVCVLLANDMGDLPATTVRSILYRSHARVVVGYLDAEDLVGVPLTDRVEAMDLRTLCPPWLASVASPGYAPYGTSRFSQLVMLKWLFVQHVLQRTDVTTVVYSDSDVVWLEDAAYDLHVGMKRFDTSFLVQSQAGQVAEIHPCAGFFAVRADPVGRAIVEAVTHRYETKLREAGLWTVDGSSSAYIDDEALLRDALAACDAASWRELPQAVYPTGNMISLFEHRDPPGPPALVFHANYAVGLDAKAQLIARALTALGRDPITFAPLDGASAPTAIRPNIAGRLRNALKRTDDRT